MGKSYRETPWKYKKDKNFQKKQKQKQKHPHIPLKEVDRYLEPVPAYETLDFDPEN